MPGKKIIKKVAKKKNKNIKTTKHGRQYGPDYDRLDDIIDNKYSDWNPNKRMKFNKDLDVEKMDEMWMRKPNPYGTGLDDPLKRNFEREKRFWDIKGKKYGGSQVVNHKGIRVPGMYKDGGAKRY